MINKDDPRLTAYLLGELDEAGHDEIQSALAESEELRQHLDGLRETIDAIQNAFGADGSAGGVGADELTQEQIAAVEAAAAITPLQLGDAPSRVWMRRFAIAALVLYAIGISFFAFRDPPPLPVAATDESKAVLPMENPVEPPRVLREETAEDAVVLMDAIVQPEAIEAEPARRETDAGELDQFRMPSASSVVDVRTIEPERESQPRVANTPEAGDESVTIGFDGISGLPSTEMEMQMGMGGGSLGAGDIPAEAEAPSSADEPVDAVEPEVWSQLSRRRIDVAASSTEQPQSGGIPAAAGMQASVPALAPVVPPAPAQPESMARGGAAIDGFASEPLIETEAEVAQEPQRLSRSLSTPTAPASRAATDAIDRTQLPQNSGDWATKVDRSWLESLAKGQQPETAPAAEASGEPGTEADFEINRQSVAQAAKPLAAAATEPGRVAAEDREEAEAAGERAKSIAPSDEARTDRPVAAKTWKPASASTNRARLSVGHHDDLLLAARDTYVRIDGFRARVMFDLYYYNDRGRQLEGQFMLRLPDDAALHYFAFGAANLPTPRPVPAPRNTGKPGDDVQAEPFDPAQSAVAMLRKQTESVGSDLARRASDALYKAESNSTFGLVKTAYVAPRQKAALAYEETVRRRVDPALVEWAGPGIFQTKVFPLLPGKLHRIVVGYDVSLDDIEDDRLFTLDLPEDEAGGRVEFDIVAAGGTSATLTPPTDPFVSGGRAYYRYEGAAPRDYTARIAGTKSVVIQHADAAGGQYFATQVIADLPDEAAKVDTRRAVMMLDTSWSDRPVAFARRLDLLKQILSDNRDTIDEFAVMTFNVHQRWWQNEFVANDQENLDRFMEFAGELALEGATDLHGAVAEATRPAWRDAADTALPEPNFFLLSDAVATWGATDLNSIAKPLSGLSRQAGGGALFTYQFTGLPSDRVAMRVLAEANGGAVFNVGEQSDLAKAATAHRSRPWLLDSANADGAEEVLVQGGATTVYPGQQLLVAGRGDLQGPIELVFRRGGETQAMTIDPNLSIKSPAAARLYGGLAVDRLEPYAGEMEEITVAFARYFRVPGRTCSMVMLESAEDYQRFGVSTSPEEDHLVIASTSVESVTLAEQSKQAELRSNSRARFLSWVESLESASLMNVPTALRLAIKRMPDDSFAFTPRPLRCRSYRRADFGPTYLDELAIETPAFDSVMTEADEMLISFGADDAIKTASTMVEVKPGDVDTLRSVAFRAIEWKRGDQAAPLMWKITQARPYQPQCLMLLARSLAAGGDLDSAIVCYDLVTAGNWNERWQSAKGIAKVELISVLEQVDPQTSAIGGYARARLRQLREEIAREGLDIAVFMHWNTDRTDVDLHVTEPSGEVCFYKNKSTKSGGQMTDDITQGLGPEMYTLPSALEGGYQIQAKYFRSDQNRTKAPTEILVTLVRDLGRPTMKALSKRVTLSGDQEMETVMRFQMGPRGQSDKGVSGEEKPRQELNK